MYQLLFGDEKERVSPPPGPKATPIQVPPPPSKRMDKPITVTQLTDLIKTAIHKHVPETVVVTGEISNFVQANSGHIYFTLKDSFSQICCALWRSNAQRLKFTLEDGLAVTVRGYVDLYPPRGQYQLYVERVDPAGVGALELAFRQLKEKLEKEGLFDPSRKKPIPAFPLTIGVVTSPTGAAIRDILRTLELRWPVGRVLVYPVQVQGDGAANQIAAALRDLNAQADRLGGIDVILLARGGGSLEDLWPFNEEVVARAVHASRLPVISGVGHEVDVTIADLVADLRAATPTAAAQAATPPLEEVLDHVNECYLRLKGLTTRILKTERVELLRLADRGMFRHPVVILGPFARRFDELNQRLKDAMKKQVQAGRLRAHRAELALGRIAPDVVLSRARTALVKLQQQLKYTGGACLVAHRGNLNRIMMLLRERRPVQRLSRLALTVGHLEARLAACDYRNVLRRGFAVARRAKDSKIITGADMVAADDTIITELADGTITSRVEQTGKTDAGRP